MISGSAAKAFAFERAGVPYYEDWKTMMVAMGL
jgi:hypothetical protein